MTLKALSWTLALLALPVARPSTQPADALEAVQRDVSIASIRATLQAIDHDRTSGREGERNAADYLAAKLREYGIEHRTHEVRAYLSWPGKAALSLEGGSGPVFRAVTPAFGASTGPAGVSADLVWVEDESDEAAWSSVRGRFVVLSGLVSPEGVFRAQERGAAGVINVNETDVLHEMIATTIWGTPTSESAARLPRIPVVSIGASDGTRLKSAAGGRGARVRMVTEVERGWTNIPLVVAEVRGRRPDFVLVATHLDAWYEGMTDTGGTVASILEMARVLAGRRAALERSVRFAWWPGHSFGRYAGSTWYADRFWADLDRHAVAYTNLDGSGRRGSRLDEVSARGWPGLDGFSREFAERLTGKAPAPGSDRLFRPGRDSDSAFQGLGIPEFSIGVPGPPRGHPDVTPGGRIAYWHTAEDTLDKIDEAALELDTRYRVAQLYELLTMPVLPHRIAPIAESYVRAIDEIGKAAGGVFDLTPVREAAAALRSLAARLDAAPRPTDPARMAQLDALLVRLTHRLNSRLYTAAGRFDQDPAAPVPMLPLLAEARRLATLPADSDEAGFLETSLVRGRNAVLATLTEAREAIEHYPGSREERPSVLGR